MKKQMLSILEGNKTNLSSRWVWRPAGCRDLPHPLLLGQEEKQPCFTRDVEDPRVLAGRANSGMTGPFYHGTKAFTLIELLVVVLIIGILAAVAVPQYQKAVEKSRTREALSLLKSVYQAAKAYEMANGAWPESFDELAVEIPWTGNVQWRESSYIRDTRSNDLWSLQLYKTEGDEQVLLGRISGKYEGVGFGINSGGAWRCVEKTAKGKVFSGKTGDYCVKIMRTGTTYTTYLSGRYYSYQP